MDEVDLTINFSRISRTKAIELVENALETVRELEQPVVNISFDKAMVDE